MDIGHGTVYFMALDIWLFQQAYSNFSSLLAILLLLMLGKEKLTEVRNKQMFTVTQMACSKQDNLV